MTIARWFSRALALIGLAAVMPAPMAAQAASSQSGQSGQSGIVPVQTASPGAVRGFGPNGATLRCKDGTFPAAGAPDSACNGKGGVLVRYPIRRTPPTANPTPAPATVRAAPAQSTAPVIAPPPEYVSAEQRHREARLRQVRTPEGATLLCNDGTYIARDTVRARCQAHGGVKARIVAPRTP